MFVSSWNKYVSSPCASVRNPAIACFVTLVGVPVMSHTESATEMYGSGGSQVKGFAGLLVTTVCTRTVTMPPGGYVPEVTHTITPRWSMVKAIGQLPGIA